MTVKQFDLAVTDIGKLAMALADAATTIAEKHKEHVGEFLALLEILDPRQAEYIKKGGVEIAELLGGK